MKPLTKAVTLFAFAGAATAFTPSGIGSSVTKLTPGAVHGDIDVVSFGVATISADKGPALSAVHVRETLTNRAETAGWVVDFTETRLWLGGATLPVHPMFINSDAATLPLLVVGRGQHRVVDLYFPLGEGRIDDDSLAQFTVTYRIHTPDHQFETSVMLARTNHWPSREERSPEPGWGRRWWSDPGYPWTQYWHRPGYALPRPPRQIEILHTPRAYYDEVPAVAEDWPRTAECDEW